jgi:multimeric flavodoxin WrbA
MNRKGKPTGKAIDAEGHQARRVTLFSNNLLAFWHFAIASSRSEKIRASVFNEKFRPPEERANMKVLAFNASPLMEKGNTALLMMLFLEGIQEEGCEVELFYTCSLHVKPCLGNRACWTKTPGRCVQDGDVKMLLPKIRGADVIVFAAPVYADGMPGTLKNLIECLIPIVEPYFVTQDGHCRHPPREPHKHSKVVLVSNCGFWEMDNFEPLVKHMQAICKNTCWEFTGALLRPHGEALDYMVNRGIPVQDIFDAAKNAGKELVKTGKIGEENMKIASRNLVPLETYVEMANKGFKQVLDKLGQTKCSP